MTVRAVTDANFEQEVLASELPVLIDFKADWCQPCKQLSPIVAEVAQELEGKLKVVEVDVDRNPNVAAAFRIQSVPTLFVVHQGQVVGGQPGLVPKEAILEMVQPLLPADAAEVKPDELAKLIQAQRVVAVDVRDAGSYGRAHIPGAIHVAKDELTTRASELRPADGRLRVLYGRTTDEAKEAADGLRESGVDVGFLDGGMLGWEAEGFEVER
ncbi:MAG TPA: thioredoxin [Sandaracinaceae bacterium LLY-WYZ-13_1]|nr:thioredoxin [Sandaracinaceae bacterium LLY-WYZ-13_1]